MRPQRTAGRTWVSRLGRTAFALTTMVVIPLATAQRMMAPKRPPSLPSFRDLQQRLEDFNPSDWPPLDPPIRPQYAPVPRGPFVIDPGAIPIDPGPARKAH